MKKIRILSLVIAVVMLVCVFAACTDNGNNNDGKKEIVTGDGLYHAENLPDVNYEDASFRILTVHNDTTLYTDFDADADASNKVLAALYKRNRLIENNYGVKFVEERTDGWEELTTKMADYVGSGDDAYELNMLIQRDAFSYGVKGYIMQTDMLEYNDPTQPWYVHDVNSELTVDNISFFAYSDECLNMFAQTCCIFFNAKIAEDYDIKSPYEHIEDNTWTLENFFGSAKEAARDLNSDSSIDDYDIIGIVAECDMAYPTYWVGAGIKTIEKDENDYPSLTAKGNEKFIKLLGEIQDLYNEDGVFYDTAAFPSVQYSELGDYRVQSNAIFTNDHALYRSTIVGTIAEMSEMDSDFGLVPAPKYDEAQENYHSRVIDGWINVVPATNTHLDMTSVIMEALAVESKNYVYDAYYHEQLQDRYTRDPKAIEMLDLIASTRAIDLGDTVWQAAVRYKIQEVIWSGSNTFASKLSSIKDVVDFTIDNALEELNDR